MNSYTEIIAYLESLQMMPKTMPGLQKIKKALQLTDWYESIDPNRIIIVAGTNGKGTTCAALETLLDAAGQRVGLYTSPHLISTTERIRINTESVSEKIFVELFNDCSELIKECELSHFEALTLMAGHYFFSSKWGMNLDFIIFEVGLGGLYDATNAFPHKYSIITTLGMDHTNILGNNLVEIASNKFGIISKKNIVIHHQLPQEIFPLKAKVQKETNSNWIEAEEANWSVEKRGVSPKYFINYSDLRIQINIPGRRSVQNIMTAITAFQILGFELDKYYSSLNKIKWYGRMQKIIRTESRAALYLSGDHNEQGIESLIEILQDFEYKKLHLIVGMGVDKDAEGMLKKLTSLTRVYLYLTETPFKGLKLDEYPKDFVQLARAKDSDVMKLLEYVDGEAGAGDLVLITGSLYLVGEVLKSIPFE